MSQQPTANSQQPTANSQQPTEASDFESQVKLALEKLYTWQYGFRRDDDFNFKLFSLFQLSSREDFEKLALAYPAEAAAYRLWWSASDPEDFFSKHGIWKGPRGKF